MINLTDGNRNSNLKIVKALALFNLTSSLVQFLKITFNIDTYIKSKTF